MTGLLAVVSLSSERGAQFDFNPLPLRRAVLLTGLLRRPLTRRTDVPILCVAGRRKPNLSVAALAAAVAAPSKRPQPEGLLAKLERARQERDRARQQQQQATTAAAPA